MFIVANVVLQAINKTFGKRDSMKDILASNIKLVLTVVDDISMEEIDSQLKELQWKLFKVANSNGNYDSIMDEIYQFRELKQNVMVNLAERECMKMSIG